MREKKKPRRCRGFFFSWGMAVPSLHAFNALPLPDQLAIVVGEGTYLTMRFGEEGDRINLYHMGNFFAEVFYDPEVNHLHQCRTFVSTGPLDAYVDGIWLPNEHS